MRPKKTPTDYHLLAQKRGFRWLGPMVPSTQTKTEWECVRGHRWQARYSHIGQGRGCPICAGKIPKIPADYEVLAQKRGFLWLGPEVPNARTKTNWECAKGHRWQARYNNIQQGRGCPICGGSTPRGPSDYHNLAKQRGFHWLGPTVPNTQTKTGWECVEGHCWQATYSYIHQGSNCLVCARKLRASRRARKAGRR